MVQGDYGRAYLWKPFIRGPDISEIFHIINEGYAKSTDVEKTPLAELHHTLRDIAIERILYWQTINYPLVGRFPKAEEVRGDYIRTIREALTSLAALGPGISESEAGSALSALEQYNWAFLKEETLKRNMAATYRNFVLETDDLSPTSKTLLSLFTQQDRLQIDRSRLSTKLYVVDTASKYSCALEDLAQLDISVEGPKTTPENSAVMAGIRHYAKKGVSFSPETAPFMLIDRALRNSYFILGLWLPSDVKELTKRKFSEQEFDANVAYYRRALPFIFEKGERALQVLKAVLPAEQVTILKPFTRTLDNFFRTDPTYYFNLPQFKV
jgi:hypothetical protein